MLQASEAVSFEDETVNRPILMKQTGTSQH